MNAPLHVTPEMVVDLAEGRGSDRARRHVEACDRCRARVAETREMLQALGTGEVPEPSPLFWDHFSARVSRAVEAEAQTPAATPWWRTRWGRWSSAIGGVAVVVMAVTVGLRLGRPLPQATDVARPGAATERASAAAALALVATPADDEAFAVVAELSEGLMADGDDDGGLVVGPGAAEQAVDRLSPDEQGELVRLLEAELARRPS